MTANQHGRIIINNRSFSTASKNAIKCLLIGFHPEGGLFFDAICVPLPISWRVCEAPDGENKQKLGRSRPARTCPNHCTGGGGKNFMNRRELFFSLGAESELELRFENVKGVHVYLLDVFIKKDAVVAF